MIKSKERIAEFGEVFTSEREVNAMLDLVEGETYRIDSRFLEPACGDGNFLNAVLSRKLKIVFARYKKSLIELQRYTFCAVSSVYGIDILLDNVEICRERLLLIVKELYAKNVKEKFDEETFFNAIKFVLNRNIIHGDALSLMNPATQLPIVFSEWCLVTGNKVKRTDYTLNNLLAYQPFDEGTLFSDLGEEVVLSVPLKSYPIRNILELCDENN